jgi:predicted RNase H-like nuclease (RuvC/YqgF family)
VWTIEKLKQRFSLSDQQIYRRLHEARRLLQPHIRRGDKNAILLTEGGFRILENILELEKQGRTLANAVQEVEKHLQNGSENPESDELLDKHPENLDKLYKTEYRSLLEQIGYLKGQLDLKEELIRELKEELQKLREENTHLKSKVALVEYHEQKRWWQFWK